MCVNLEHNQLTNLSGLIHLPNLKVSGTIVLNGPTPIAEPFQVLCLNYNRIESVFYRPNKSRIENRGRPAADNAEPRTVLDNLEVLHLA